MGPENIYLVGILGFCAFLCNFLYAMGGTEMSFGGQKWLRRFLGSSILATSANGAAIYLGVWVWQYLLMYPCLIIGFSMGYGGDTVLEKTFKRFLCALGVLSACIAGLYATGFTPMGWVITGLATITGLTSIVLGVWNPWKNAVVEQFVICQVLCLYVPFWAFVK